MSDSKNLFDILNILKYAQSVMPFLKYTTFIPFSYVVIYYIMKIAFDNSNWLGAITSLLICLVARHYFHKVFNLSTLPKKIIFFTLTLIIAASTIYYYKSYKEKENESKYDIKNIFNMLKFT